jgi:pilus assembly protein CpaF
MSMTLQQTFQTIQKAIDAIPLNEFLLSVENQSHRSDKVMQIIQDHSRGFESCERIREEFLGLGPLTELIRDEQITEILVNGPFSIWYEKRGQLHRHEDQFWSELTYRNALEKIGTEAQVQITLEHPCVDGSFRDFRLSLIDSSLTRKGHHLSLRRHPTNPWTFEKLQSSGWCSKEWGDLFAKLMREKKNMLVIGSTGSGKTSVLNSLLQLIDENQRVVAIEDTSEVALPNSASMKLLTREEGNGVLPPIDQAQLVKRSLRLRPDRIVMGEVRGSEAKDFLMALATGHRGSLGTLHANDPQQALIRLEMLIQMGAPHWSLTAIRRLIQLSLDVIVVTEKNAEGERRLVGVYQLSSLEDQGFLVDPLEPTTIPDRQI